MTERGSTPAEFDEHAAGYDGGFDAPLKRLVGGAPEAFIEPKTEWLLRDLGRAGLLARAPRLLDYGCGNAIMLRVLQRGGYPGALEGCDVSPGMLQEARRAWRAGEPPPLHLMRQGRAPLADASFDVVVSSGVFHHIDRAERQAAFAEIFRLIAPGGRGYVFEHNPYNPVTQWVVRRTAIDADAVLLSAREARRGLERAGFVETRTAYLMFFPPRLRGLPGLRVLERGLGPVPLGGQFVVGAHRPG